jgi:predicted lipase
LQPFKHHQADKKLATHADVKETVTSWLQTLVNDFFHIVIQALVLRLNRCVNVTGDYVEV